MRKIVNEIEYGNDKDCINYNNFITIIIKKLKEKLIIQY